MASEVTSVVVAPVPSSSTCRLVAHAAAHAAPTTMTEVYVGHMLDRHVAAARELWSSTWNDYAQLRDNLHRLAPDDPERDKVEAARLHVRELVKQARHMFLLVHRVRRDFYQRCHPEEVDAEAVAANQRPRKRLCPTSELRNEA